MLFMSVLPFDGRSSTVMRVELSYRLIAEVGRPKLPPGVLMARASAGGAVNAVDSPSAAAGRRARV
jgi:hypothetical protein